MDSASGQAPDGSRRRIAHKGASSAPLLYDLQLKRASISKLLNMKSGQTSRRADVSPIAKRSRKSLTSEKDKKSYAPSIKTFCGQPFMSAVSTSQVERRESRPTIKSDSSSDSDPEWLSKPKVVNGTMTKSGKCLPTDKPRINFTVKRRAVLSSSGDETYKSDEDIEKQVGQNGVTKSKANSKLTLKESCSSKMANRGNVGKKSKGKQLIDSSDDDDNDFINDYDDEAAEDEEEIERTPSSSELSSEEDDLNAKKSLKELTAKAKRLHNHRKRRGTEIVEEALQDDDEDEGDDDEVDDDAYDSEDSDAGERQSKVEIRKRANLEKNCIECLNTATEEELTKIEKFNAKMIKLVLENRPFRDFQSLNSTCSEILRGSQMLEQYLDYLESRSVLDKVLEECKKKSEYIKRELTQLQDSKLNTQPTLLSKDCVLHPHQQVGLQWLIMMHNLGLNAILADEMGLGKTIQIVAFLAWAKENKITGPHLIIVPSSTLENWMREIDKWCPSLKLLTYYGTISERSQLRHRACSRSVDVILTTYNMVISRAEDRNFFKKFSINYVIYDEGHMLRSCNTMRYKSLMRVKGKRKILLTGTPLQNNLVELISLLYFAMTKMFSKYCENISQLLQMFAHKSSALHSGKQRNNNNHSAVSKKKKGKRKNEEDEDDDEVMMVEEETEGNEKEDGPMYEKHKIAQAKNILQPYILRRLKTNVLNDLPTKHEEIKMCDITETQDEIYVEILNDFLDARQNGTANGMGSLMQMRQVSNHPLLYRKHFHDDRLYEIAKILCSKEPKYRGKKMEHVAEDLSYLTDIAINNLCKKFESLKRFQLQKKLALDSGKCKQLDILLPKIFAKNEKALIFSQFTTLLDVLEIYCDFRGYKFCRLDGSTPVMERQELINQFYEDPSIEIFLLSTKAGGLGINLTAANNIIIHDIDLNPYNDKQAEDRCHRLGQTREVHVTRLISKNTVEESILELALKKLELEKDVTSHGSNQKEEELDSGTVEDMLKKALFTRNIKK